MTAQIGLELAAENLQGSTLSNTVGSNKTEDLARTRHGQPMKFEAVGAIAMSNLTLEIGGQIDNGDGFEGTLLRADTASDAEGLGNEGEARIGGDFDAEFTASHDGAGFFTLLATLSGTALM